MRAENEVAQVLEKAWEEIERSGFNNWQLRTLRAIKSCRTAALGGHVDECDECGHIKISYNSCRNRHCPKCQGQQREKWIAARTSELLPVSYFHVVFTLPEALNRLALYKPKIVYDVLFRSAWQTIEAFAGKQRKAGMISILHTWGQNLSLHPHIHCIIPGGTVNPQGLWYKSKNRGKFLYPVKALSKVFRAKYMASLRTEVDKEEIPNTLFDHPWVVYAKKPFGGPASVIEYLGRYTHKIAISDHRIESLNNGEVSFWYKDYKQGGKKQLMRLTYGEFVRRFTLHILPKRFVRIRHYGFLSSSWKSEKLGRLQTSLTKSVVLKQVEVIKSWSLPSCPCCKTGKMHIIETFGRRGPPDLHKQGGENETASCIA